MYQQYRLPLVVWSRFLMSCPFKNRHADTLTSHVQIIVTLHVVTFSRFILTLVQIITTFLSCSYIFSHSQHCQINAFKKTESFPKYRTVNINTVRQYLCIAQHTVSRVMIAYGDLIESLTFVA